MSSKIFSSMEIDAIGEIMNISLGSSATAVSNMLDHRVDITTPQVFVENAEDFTLGNLEPAIGVEIRYVAGLEGSNIMLLKMHDVKVITDILMGMETPDEEFELNELTLSAVCEVMNQMMGSASTALSDFLGRVVDISTPQTFDADDVEAVKAHRLPVPKGPIVIVKFALSIEDSMKSEFMNVISVELAKELVSGFGLENIETEEEEAAPEPAPAPAASSGGTMSQDEIERLMTGMGGTPEPAPAPAASSGGTMSQDEIERLMTGMGGTPGPAPAPTATPPQAASTPQPGTPGQMPGMQGMPGMPGQTPGGQGPMPGMPGQTPGGQSPMPGMPGQTPGGQGQMPGQMPGMPGMPPYYYPPYGYDGQAMPYPPMYYMPPNGWPGMPGMGKEEEKPKAKLADQKVIQTKSLSMPKLDDGTELSQEQNQNLDLIMSVPLEIAVEIGRTRKKVQDILALSKGSLVVLDKLAGDQVDVYVNGKCIAHGDVVVIDDNFGIRITEIIKKPGLEDLR